MKFKPLQWDNYSPRRCQREGGEKIINHLLQEKPVPSAVRIITGGGKSPLIAEIANATACERNETLLVTTSTRMLVRQLRDTCYARIPDSDFLNQRIGCYYTDKKEPEKQIVICCNASAIDCANDLEKLGKKVGLWVLDEAHRGESPQMHEAAKLLVAERIVGFTATPWLADVKRRLTMFDKLIYEYSVADAIRDGNVVVPWEIVPYTGKDSVNLEAACLSMIKNAKGPGVISSKNIQHAVAFSKFLNDNNFKAEPIHSKLKDSEVKERIAALKSGALRALVHVSMFQEGVDFPWIEWMCLARPVASRVRFAQEVGRGLRACPDTEKKKCVYYDPHDLFGDLKLSYEAVLGGEYEEAESSEKTSASLDKFSQFSFDAMEEIENTLQRTTEHTTSLNAVQTYLRNLVVAFDVAGLIPERKIVGRAWKNDPVSDNQRFALSKISWVLEKGGSFIPASHKQVLKSLCKIDRNLNKGLASDLMSILYSMVDNRKFPDVVSLERAVEEAGVEA